MGMRLHVATKYEVEHNTHGKFNNAMDVIFDDLRKYGVQISDCYSDYPDDFSIEEEEFKRFLDNLPDGPYKDDWHELAEQAGVDQYGYIHFSWF